MKLLRSIPIATLGAATLFAGGALLPTAANAETAQDEHPYQIEQSQDTPGEDGTVLFTLVQEGYTAQGYSLEKSVAPSYGVDIQPGGPNEYPGTNNYTDPSVRAHVGWIVNDSYPTVGLEHITEKLGVHLSEAQAIGATQDAIWHFTDGAEPSLSPDAKVLYDYLTGDANVGSAPPAPEPTVSFTGADQPFDSNGRVGPVTVTSNQPTVSINADTDYPVVDANGNQLDLDNVPSGTQLYLQVPKTAPADSIAMSAKTAPVGTVGGMFVVPTAAAPAPTPDNHGATILGGGLAAVSGAAHTTVSWSAAAGGQAPPAPGSADAAGAAVDTGGTTLADSSNPAPLLFGGIAVFGLVAATVIGTMRLRSRRSEH